MGVVSRLFIICVASHHLSSDMRKAVFGVFGVFGVFDQF